MRSSANGAVGVSATVSKGKEALDRLLELKKNWDSYDAEPISPDAVRAAELIFNPQIIPTVVGGVLVEWRWVGESCVTIEFNAKGEVSGVSWEKGS